MARVANYDFCPNWNWLFHKLKEPIGWVVTAIVFSLLVGLFVGTQGYVLAFAFTTLLIAGLAWPWISMQGVRCRLVLPDRRITEKQNLEVVFQVKNYWPLPIFGMMVKGDFLQDLNDGDESVAFALKHVAAWSESEFRIPLTPHRRGRLPTGDVVTTNGFPFGLVDISKTVTHSTTAIVWPACESFETFPVADSTRFSLHGALRDQSGDDGESIGVRDYRNGDRLRNVHWAQTVRTHGLKVRERQKLAAADATVVLDLSPLVHAGHGSQSSYEWAIRIAASICSHLHEAQSLVRVVCIGLPHSLQSTTDNRLGLRAVMDFLADLPVLVADRETEDCPANVGRATPELQFGGRLFLIGTNRSTQLPNFASPQVTPVIMDFAGFDDTSPVEFMEATEPPKIESESPLPGDGISIVDPHSAAEQLTGMWNRSFGDAC